MFSKPLHQQHLQKVYQKVIGTGTIDPARIFYELLSRDHADGRATGQPSRGTAGLDPRRT